MTPTGPITADSAETTDPTLLQRLSLIPSDETAWRQFIQRYGKKIHAFCVRWGLQGADAEEVTARVLLKLVKKLRNYRYDSRRSFRGYLHAVTRNSLRDYHHERTRAGLAVGADDRIALLLENQVAREELSDLLNRQFDLELMERALDSIRGEISERDWEVFRLLTLEGLPGEAVAKSWNLPTAHAYVIKGRVLKRIQQLLGEFEEERV